MGKEKKDPTAPKRATTAFMYFSNEMRKKVREQDPSLAMTQIAEVLGKLWGSMSDEDKAKYQSMANADKKRYEEEKKNWEPPAKPAGSSASSSSSSSSGKSSKKGSKKSKDPNSPKRGLSAYLFFASDIRPQLRAQYPTDAFPLISSKIGELWKQLDPSQKQPYEEKAEADKKRYERELEAYKANGGGAGATTSTSSKKSKSKSKSSSSPSKKVKDEDNNDENEEEEEEEEEDDEDEDDDVNGDIYQDAEEDE